MFSALSGADMFVITTNSFVKTNGALVMGKGIARTVRDTFIGIDRDLGGVIKAGCGHLGEYGLIRSIKYPKIFALQVKHNFVSKADVNLIAEGVAILAEFAERYPNASIHLNYPGIGNGGLPKSLIHPIVDTLPDNVTVWELPKGAM